MTDNIEQLIDGCVQGKIHAQKKLYRQYKKVLLGICFRYARDRSEAEDILLEGFVNIFSKISTYSFQGSFEGWMKRVVIHSAIDYFRRNKKELFHQDIDDYKNDLVFEEDIINNLSAREILKIVQTLPTGYRMVFNLFAIEGYSHKEIAEKLDISENTSKSQLSKARKWLTLKLNALNNLKVY